MATVRPHADNMNKLDWMKWAIVALLLVAGFAANYTVAVHLAAPLRFAGWIVLACVVTLVAAQTAKGQKAREYVRLSHMELRKVFWPNRQEVMQTTLVVAAIVALMAIVLWGIDAI